MNLGIAGKRALVTGSTAGIGFATARALAREGARVVVNGRTQARVDTAVAAIRAAVPGAHIGGVAADLGTAAGCEDQVPVVDILVNNVGIFEVKPFEDITDADWLRFFEVNVLSGVRLTRHYLPSIRTGNWGRVVFVSSESAVQIPTEMIHYGMTKTAQLAIARGLAETLAGTDVTVNSVERDFFASARPSSVIRRFASPDEVAAMIAYLCSAPASATTGAALRVDGGVVRAIV